MPDMKAEWHRPMVLEVIERCANGIDHICLTPDGSRITVDLFTAGTMDGTGFTYDNIIGGKVRVDYIHPYAYLAEGVSPSS